MRVNNTTVNSLAAQSAPASAQKVGQSNSQLTTGNAGANASDQATLSSASNLVALAKSAVSSSRQAKISALTDQVRSGSYQGDTGRAGQAMVQELLQTGTSAAPR